MESVKTFFADQFKHSGLPNNQQNSYGHYTAGSLPIGSGGNGLTNGVTGNSDAKMSNHHDGKRKDSDSYFYIMWRS